MKKVIGFFTLFYSPPLGGAERSMHNYLKMLSNDYEIHVYCFLDNGIRFSKEETFTKDGVIIHRSTTSLVPTVINFIKNKNPDLIITQLIGSEIVAQIARSNNIPLICFIHGLNEDICPHYSKTSCPYDDLETCPNGNCANNKTHLNHLSKYKVCEYIICNSEYTKNIFLKFFPQFKNKTQIAYPNFEYNDFYNKEKNENEKIKLLAINSCIPKGRDTIIGLAMNHPEFEINYVDCRPMDIEILEQVENINILHKIDHNEMVKQYHEADVTIIPTHSHETFSGVCIESLLSGTPVVASNKGNIKNIIKNGKNGFKIDNYNISEWANKIKEAKTINISKEYSEEIKNSINIEDSLLTIKECIENTIDNVDNFLVDKEKFILSEAKKTITFIARYFYPPLGGGEYFIKSILKFLKTKNYNCNFICYAPPEIGEKFEEKKWISWDGIEGYQIPVISNQILKDIIIELKTDIVVTQSYEALQIVSVAKECGCQTILGTHFWRNICEVQDYFHHMLERNDIKIRYDLHQVFHQADALYVNSDFMKEGIKKYVGIDIENIIYPILDVERSVNTDNFKKEYKRIINSDFGKGGYIFIDIAKKLKDYKFLCLGLGDEILPKNKIINNKIKELDNVKILEKTDNIKEIYGKTKMLLIPSIVDETFSMVCLEAGANGIPVISTSCGNLKYLNQDIGGIVIDDYYDIDIWCNEIKKLMENNNAYNIISNKTKKNAFTVYNPQDQYDNFLNIIKNL